ncbi:MAG: putative quinol monooxygenase [Thermoleophilia bacterium]
MAEVVLVATMKGKDGRGEAIEQAFEAAIEGSHSEAGCTYYALHRDKGAPDTVVLVEVWASEEAFASHMEEPWTQALMTNLEGLLDEPPAAVFLEPRVHGDASKGRLATV